MGTVRLAVTKQISLAKHISSLGHPLWLPYLLDWSPWHSGLLDLRIQLIPSWDTAMFMILNCRIRVLTITHTAPQGSTKTAMISIKGCAWGKSNLREWELWENCDGYPKHFL